MAKPDWFWYKITAALLQTVLDGMSSPSISKSQPIQSIEKANFLPAEPFLWNYHLNMAAFPYDSTVLGGLVLDQNPQSQAHLREGFNQTVFQYCKNRSPLFLLGVHQWAPSGPAPGA